MKINEWIESIKEEVNVSQKAIILVGNKVDVPDRAVPKQEGEEFAKKFNFKYFETSAKTGEGVKESFNELYKDVFELNRKSLDTNINLKKQRKKKDGGFC